MTINHRLTTSFHLPPEIIRSCDKYYILYWQASHVYVEILKHHAIIRERIKFLPRFIESSGISLEWLSKNPDSVVRISFRKLRCHKDGYVLIDRLKESMEKKLENVL